MPQPKEAIRLSLHHVEQAHGASATPLESVSAALAILAPAVHHLECAKALLHPAARSIEQVDLQPPRRSAAHATARSAAHATAESTIESAAGRATSRAQLRVYIATHAPVTRREILEVFGGSPHAIDNKLRRMVLAGEIVAEGRRGSRCYRPPDGPANMPRPATLAHRSPPARGVYPVYDVIVDMNGATTGQLMKRTGLPASLVVEQGRRLMQLGLVRFTGAGKTRRWLPTISEMESDAA
jgi:hypothetical protein